MENETKQKFEMYKLVDGTPIWISAFEVDGEVFIVDELMERTPIADGRYALDNGNEFVTAAGKITEVITPAEEPVAEEAPVEEAMAEEPVAEEAPVEEVVEETINEIDEAAILKVVQPKLDELMAVIAELKTMVESMNITEPTTEEVEMSAAEKLNFTLQKLRNL